MAVYDCFLFFNEFDLLELRLKTLNDFVDYFVILEAPWTFSGKPKPLYFKEFYDGYRPWLKKIRHIALDGDVEARISWEREWLSREALAEGFKDAAPDDWIFQSDCDEIWRPELRDAAPNDEIATYIQFHCYYSLNTTRSPHHAWRGTRRYKFKDYHGGQKLRDAVGREIENGGWHFSFLGDEWAAKMKLESFSHTEFGSGDYVNENRIRKCIEDGTDLITPYQAFYVPVAVDATFPKPVLEDPDRWAKFIKSPPVSH